MDLNWVNYLGTLIFYLCDSPFNHRTASHTGAIDLFKVIVRIAQILGLHLLPNFITVENEELVSD